MEQQVIHPITLHNLVHPLNRRFPHSKQSLRHPRRIRTTLSKLKKSLTKKGQRENKPRSMYRKHRK